MPFKFSSTPKIQSSRKQRHYFSNKGLSGQGYGFSSGHVRMWELVFEESWVPILKEISPGCSLEDWCWNWNSNTLATSCKELTHWKDPDAGRDWGQEEKGTTEDKMDGWFHRLNGHEFE